MLRTTEELSGNGQGILTIRINIFLSTQCISGKSMLSQKNRNMMFVLKYTMTFYMQHLSENQSKNKILLKAQVW